MLWPSFPPPRGAAENKGTFDEKWWSFARKSTVFIGLLPCFSSHRHRMLSYHVRLFLTVRGFSDLLLRIFVLTALLFYVFLQLSTIITERDPEKFIDFRRISCRACAGQEDFHGIRLQSEKIISLILFTAPAPEGDLPPIGEGNGGALSYDPLFTLLLCDVLRTI